MEALICDSYFKHGKRTASAEAVREEFGIPADFVGVWAVLPEITLTNNSWARYEALVSLFKDKLIYHEHWERDWVLERRIWALRRNYKLRPSVSAEELAIWCQIAHQDVFTVTCRKDGSMRVDTDPHEYVRHASGYYQKPTFVSWRGVKECDAF